MLKFLLRNAVRKFGRHYAYDTSYLTYLLDTDRQAFLKFNRVNAIAQHHRNVPPAVFFAASLRAIATQDCGPCLQLVVKMALEAGVDPETVKAIVERDFSSAPDDVVLSMRYTELVCQHAPEVDELRPLLVERWGDRGLVSLAMAITASQTYPTMKYALGFGKTCSRIDIAQESVVPVLALGALAPA